MLVSEVCTYLNGKLFKSEGSGIFLVLQINLFLSKAFVVMNGLVLAHLQVAASGEGSSISGYLSRCKKGKRHWKKLWFVIKGKVLYTYTASEVRSAVI